MSRLKVGMVLLVLLMMAVLSASASAEFKDEKGGTEIKLKGGKTSLKIGSRQVQCKTLTGLGFLAGKKGKTGEAAAEDEPASEPVKNSDDAATTLTIGECTAEILGIKVKPTVNTEKCQFEVNENTEGEEINPSTSLLSLRAAKAKEACKIIIQATEVKCEVKITAERANENEYLPELKTKNTKKFAGEIEAKSAVKEFEVSSVTGCGLSATEEKEVKEGKSTEINFEEKVSLEGVEQQGPNITVSETTMNFGKVVEATKAITFKNNSPTQIWQPIGFGLISTRRDGVAGGPVSVWTVKDKCGGTMVAAKGGTCMVEIKFNPVAGNKYKAIFREHDAPNVNLVGEG